MEVYSCISKPTAQTAPLTLRRHLPSAAVTSPLEEGGMEEEWSVSPVALANPWRALGMLMFTSALQRELVSELPPLRIALDTSAKYARSDVD